MNFFRTLLLLGPAWVIYILAGVVAHSLGQLTGRDSILALLSLAVTIVPLYLHKKNLGQELGSYRVAALGTISGVAMSAFIQPHTSLREIILFQSIILPLLGALIVDLAISVPHPSHRSWWPRVFSILLAVSVAFSSIIARWRISPFGFELWIGSFSFMNKISWYYFFCAFYFSLLIRIIREKRLSFSAQNTAANEWGIISLFPAAFLGTMIFIGTELHLFKNNRIWLDLGGIFSVLILIFGHIRLVDSTRWHESGRIGRSIVSLTWTLIIVGLISIILMPRGIQDPITFSAVISMSVIGGIFLQKIVSLFVWKILSPFNGRLLNALAIAQSSLQNVSSIESMGEAVLGPLRKASHLLDATASLILVDPQVSIRIDAAGIAHTYQESINKVLLDFLMEHLGEPLIYSDIDLRAVRHIEVRSVREVMAHLQVLCVMPLVFEGQLEGALIIPRGRRQRALTFEEITALNAFASMLAARVSVIAESLRARIHIGNLLAEHDLSIEECMTLREKNKKLQQEVLTLRRGDNASTSFPAIAYAESTRIFEKRIEEIATTEANITFISEWGDDGISVVKRVHQMSGRNTSSLIIGDCSQYKEDELEEHIFGTKEREGWISLAQDGSLLLIHPSAIPLDVQQRLADTLATKMLIPVGGFNAQPIDIRVFTISHVSLINLVEQGQFDEELARRLTQIEIAMPPLRDRKEDLPSIILFAIDLACRILGKPRVGITQAAIDRLLAWSWPGNIEELRRVIFLAITKTQNEMIDIEHLPPLDASQKNDDLLSGTFYEIEQRVLEHALMVAQGNKTTAAKSLGLARTTFIDKLRRYQLGEES